MLDVLDALPAEISAAKLAYAYKCTLYIAVVNKHA